MNAIRTILAVMLASLGAACSASEPVEQPAQTGPALVVEGNNQFALALYQKLRTGDGNLFFSPYSISTALAMTYAGAEGKTEQQMAQTLCFPTSPAVLEQIGVTGVPLSRTDFATTFGTLIKDLNAQGEEGRYDLKVANALWGQAGHAFLPAFVERVESAYGGRLRTLDFIQAAKQARQTINTWVEQQTNGKIRDLIGPGVLGPMTRLVLTNAIYFKGNWATQFREDRTRPAPFALSSGATVETPLMNQKEHFGYAEVEASDRSPSLQILDLPYVGEALSMTILLPQELDDLKRLEAQFNSKNLKAWLAALRRREVKVTIPKFKMTNKFSLERVLSGMGMVDAFSSSADFSGMTGKRDFIISAVIHQAYVDVNEEGTEAAAATGVVMKMTSIGPDRTPVFRADHPFIFLIRDNKSGSILFLGRVMNPKAES